VDHVPDEEFGFWESTFPLWHEQGLSPECNNNGNCDPYFGFAPRSGVPVGVGMTPGFETKTLEETDEYRIERNSNGVITKVFTGGGDTIPQFMDHTLKDRKSWEEEFLPRLDIALESRYPENRDDWEDIKARFNSPDWDRPVGINIGSIFGWLRDWMGFENITVMMYDDPKLMHDMIEHLATLTTTVIRKSAEEINIDYAAGWEDMAFRQGPMISPTMFREFLTPRYKMITDVLHENDIDIIFTDCDGRVIDAIDPWLEGGLTGIFPCEVGVERDQTDPIAVREKWGEQVVILGGVNKHALGAGKDAIREEIKRMEPYVKEGGWIPHVDHRCPPTVAFEDYLFYLDLKRDTFGIPRPEEFEARPEIKKIKERPGYWKS
jgi:uroporphyrinogen decarboxylase